MKKVSKAILYDRNGNIMILHRNGTHPHFPGHFDFPGGEVEQGEMTIDAIQREILEETGISISRNKFKLVVDKQISSGLNHTVYVAHLDDVQPRITLSWEHAAYEWMAPENLLAKPLPKNVDNYYLTALEYLQTTLSASS